MIDRVHEVDSNRTHTGRVCAGGAAIFLLVAQIALGAPVFSVDESEGPPTTSLPGMADTVISEDMGVDDLLAGIGDSDAAGQTSADDTAVSEPFTAPAPLPSIADDPAEAPPMLPPLTAEALPPLMLEKSALQADLSVVPGVTLNKIRTMSLSSFSAGAAAAPASAPVLPPAAPLALTPRIPVMQEAVNPLPDPFPVRSEPRAGRHIVSEPQPARVQSTPRPSAPAVTVLASRGGTHRVARGETLADVAALYYRDRTRWVDVYEANRDMIDKGSLEPGQILAIP